VDLGNYAQFLNDPNIVKIQFLVTAFLVIANFSIRILAFLDANLFSSDKKDAGSVLLDGPDHAEKF
jgi:hypothetical protein